jgi:hypothetical protein
MAGAMDSMSSSIRKFLRPLILVTTLAWSAAPALAQPSSSQIILAKEWFDEGLKLEKEGKWEQALDRFRKVADVKKTPQVHFHLGLCEAKTSLLADALLDFQRAIEGGRAEKNQQVVDAAEAELKEVRPRVPTLEIHAGDPKPSKVTIGGATLALSTLGVPMPVNPGEHEVIAEYSNGVFKKKLKIAERENAKLTLEPPAGAVAVPTATTTTTTSQPPPPPPPPDKPEKSSNVLPWIVVAGGGAAVATGVVFFIMMSNKISELDEICPDGRDKCPPARQTEVTTLEDEGRQNMLFGWIFTGVGVALAGTGVALLTLGGGDKSSKPAARIVPLLGPQGGGAMVTGAF